jgi:hypothetical protein
VRSVSAANFGELIGIRYDSINVTEIRLPSWNRRGGAKRRGGSQIQKLPYQASPLPDYPIDSTSETSCGVSSKL